MALLPCSPGRVCRVDSPDKNRPSPMSDCTPRVSSSYSRCTKSLLASAGSTSATLLRRPSPHCRACRLVYPTSVHRGSQSRDLGPGLQKAHGRTARSFTPHFFSKHYPDTQSTRPLEMASLSAHNSRSNSRTHTPVGSRPGTPSRLARNPADEYIKASALPQVRTLETALPGSRLSPAERGRASPPH